MSDNENEKVLGTLLLLLVVSWGGASLAPKAAAAAGAWLRSHAVLVDPAHALFTFPYLNAGPDARRLILLALTAIAAVALHAMSRKNTAPAKTVEELLRTKRGTRG